MLLNQSAFSAAVSLSDFPMHAVERPDISEELGATTVAVASVFHYAAPMKGLNDYPESHESLRVPSKKRARAEADAEAMLLLEEFDASDEVAA